MQALGDEVFQALTSLVSLRELSLKGINFVPGKGLTVLKDLPHLQVTAPDLIC